MRLKGRVLLYSDNIQDAMSFLFRDVLGTQCNTYGRVLSRKQLEGSAVKLFLQKFPS